LQVLPSRTIEEDAKPPSQPRNGWISEESLDLVEQKRQKFLKWQNQRENWELKEQYQRAQKEVRKRVRIDKKQWLKEATDRMEAANRKGDQRAVFREVRLLSGKRRCDMIGMKGKKGKAISTNESLQVFSEYFKTLLNVEDRVDKTFLEDIEKLKNEKPEFKPLAETPTEDEINCAIESLSKRKAPGEDGIIGEMLQLSLESLREAIRELIIQCWQEEIIPQEWQNGILVPIFKAGVKTNPDNYRGIALLNIAGKILAKIINTRIAQAAEMIMLEQQCGFRKNRGTTEQIFNLRQIVERHIEWNADCVMVFIDLKKAYDTVSRKLMMGILRAEGLPDKLVKLVERFYDHTTFKVRLQDQLSETVEIGSGVRQGCVMSPTLFNIFLNFLLKQILPKLQEKGVKIQYRIGTSLFNLPKGDDLTANEWGFLYADDLALTASNLEDLHESLMLFDGIISKGGMEISINKTKFMVTGGVRCEDKMSMGEKGDIEKVDVFKYLGSYIRADGMMKTDIAERIKKAGNVFAMLRQRIFAPKHIDQQVKLKIYAAAILSILLYGCETWSCTAADLKKLETFHNACLRCICGVCKRSHIYVSDLRKLAGEQSIESRIVRARLRWLGHISRMDDERTPKKLLFATCIPGAVRGAGHPKLRWKDCVKTDLERVDAMESWSETVKNRNEWRKLTGEAANQKEEEKIKKLEETKRLKETGYAEYHCDACDLNFRSPPGLKTHFTRIHPEQKMVVKKDTRSKLSQSSRGIKSRNGGQSKPPSNLQCQRCGKECESASGFTRHKCNPKKQCQWCGKEFFIRAGGFTKHVRCCKQRNVFSVCLDDKLNCGQKSQQRERERDR